MNAESWKVRSPDYVTYAKSNKNEENRSKISRPYLAIFCYNSRTSKYVVTKFGITVPCTFLIIDWRNECWVLKGYVTKLRDVNEIEKNEENRSKDFRPHLSIFCRNSRISKDIVTKLGIDVPQTFPRKKIILSLERWGHLQVT